MCRLVIIGRCVFADATGRRLPQILSRRLRLGFVCTTPTSTVRPYPRPYFLHPSRRARSPDVQEAARTRLLPTSPISSLNPDQAPEVQRSSAELRLDVLTHPGPNGKRARHHRRPRRQHRRRPSAAERDKTYFLLTRSTNTKFHSEALVSGTLCSDGAMGQRVVE